MTIKRLLLVLTLNTASAAIIWAGCKSDCRDEYQSEIESCHQQYDDPDDADDLKMCLQDAKDQYNDCIEECNN